MNNKTSKLFNILTMKDFLSIKDNFSENIHRRIFFTSFILNFFLIENKIVSF